MRYIYGERTRGGKALPSEGSRVRGLPELCRGFDIVGAPLLDASGLKAQYSGSLNLIGKGELHHCWKEEYGNTEFCGIQLVISYVV